MGMALSKSGLRGLKAPLLVVIWQSGEPAVVIRTLELQMAGNGALAVKSPAIFSQQLKYDF